MSAYYFARLVYEVRITIDVHRWPAVVVAFNVESPNALVEHRGYFVIVRARSTQ